MAWYCDTAPGHPLHGPYHDREYGFPATDERVLFERLSLEIFQAGLSWLIVLQKRTALQAAFAGFEVDRVAAFDASDEARLVATPSIIRNRRKIAAVIANAQRIASLRHSSGGIEGWLASHHPQPLEAWTGLFRKTFLFTGPEVVREFLLSTGHLPGAHRETCPTYADIVRRQPPWLIAARSIGATTPGSHTPL